VILSSLVSAQDGRKFIWNKSATTYKILPPAATTSTAGIT